MGDKKMSVSDKVRSLFRLEDDHYQCTIDAQCKYHPKSIIITNCLRHIRGNHPESFNIFQLGKDVPEEEITTRVSNKRTVKDDCANVRIVKQKVVGGLIKLVTFHGVPVSAVEWEGMRDILDPLLDALKVKINKENIVQYVKDTSATLDMLLTEEQKDEIVSMKLDTTSKHNRSVIAVSIQMYKEVKLIRRSLGIIELLENHTSTYLQEKIEELCLKFGIKKWQIYSVTIDNGRNIVKAVDPMEQDQDNISPVDERSSDECTYDNADDNAFTHCNKVTEEYEKSLNTEKIDCIRCGSHTINLVVNDVNLASERDDQTIQHIVQIVRLYRKSEYKLASKFSRAQLPPIPDKTRRNNYHSMVSILLKNRDFFSKLGVLYSELDLTDYWIYIEEYRDAFSPLYEASLKSQQLECTISQFHIEWLKAYGRVAALKSNRFRDKIMESMNKRQINLMNNNAYKATLYMDPRFMYNGSELFNHSEKAAIVSFLLGLWKKIKIRGQDEHGEPEAKEDDNKTSTDNSFSIDDYFVQLFGQGTSTCSSTQNSLEEKLLQIQYQDRVSPEDEKFNIVHYWYSHKIRDVRLWKIAKIVFAAASSQAAVELDVSTYNQIFTNTQNRLATDTIENMMKIKLNRDLLETAIQETFEIITVNE